MARIVRIGGISEFSRGKGENQGHLMGEVRQEAIGFGLTIIPQACGCSSKPIVDFRVHLASARHHTATMPSFSKTFMRPAFRADAAGRNSSASLSAGTSESTAMTG